MIASGWGSWGINILNTTTFLGSRKKKGDSIVWKEVINHRKYIRVGLKWCIRDGRKVCF